METRSEQYWFYGIGLTFVAINAFLLYKGLYVGIALPLVLLIVYAAFFRLEQLVFAMVFFTPLSLPLSEFVQGMPFDMALPTEPVIFGILIILILRWLNGEQYNLHFLRHPVSLAVYAYLAWMLITSVSSSMPVVSFKYLLARIWFVAVFYLFAVKILTKPENQRRFFALFVSALVLVIAYTINRHLGYGLSDYRIAHFVMNPFFKDHTSYGAVLAMLFPVLIAFLFMPRVGLTFKIFVGVLIPIILTAIVLSYTRAAWGSLLGALGLLIILLLRIKLKHLLVTGFVIVAFLAFSWTDILMQLEQNDQDSSGNIMEHVQSMANIATDASNLERINRWKSALRMFAERPVLGWGPGTYMFQYAAFQFSYDLTIISTNFADGGNAHSEYIGPLAESGVAGTLSFVLILILTLHTGIRAYRTHPDKSASLFALGLLLGLTTYYLHGFLNNYLDTDKASVPFWAYTAMLVILDLQAKNKIAYA